MQSTALDNTGKTVLVRDAAKGKDYFCLSCGAPVRRRGGSWKRDHFYHLKDQPSCYLSQKSATHLAVQLLLQQQLPPGEAAVEKRFPTIGRIADVAWSRYKIVYEIQYSPITIKELRERIEDYRSVGWTLVWVLHTHTFFRERPSREELFLIPYPHYYSNHLPSGAGTFFDVLWKRPSARVIQEGVELHSPLLPPIPLTELGIRGNRSLYFKNDLIDKTIQGLYSFSPTKKARFSLRETFRSLFRLIFESIFP